jgi:hypothetical protein
MRPKEMINMQTAELIKIDITETYEPKPTPMLLEAMRETEQILAQYANGTRKFPAFKSAAEMFAAMDLEDEEDDDE